MVLTNPSRNTDDNSSRIHNLLGQAVLAERVADRGYKKASQVFIRLHWNEDDKQPRHGVFRRKK
jgi:hypothetical protein